MPIKDQDKDKDIYIELKRQCVGAYYQSIKFREPVFIQIFINVIFKPLFLGRHTIKCGVVQELRPKNPLLRRLGITFKSIFFPFVAQEMEGLSKFS